VTAWQANRTGEQHSLFFHGTGGCRPPLTT